MIISASRRSDIPAFYSEWFMQRIRSGTCRVPNPFFEQQVSQVDLTPQNVEIIVFWTRNPRPLLPHLTELDRRGYRYYFHYTLLDYPSAFDPACPALQTSLDTFRRVSEHCGSQKVIWRYDPLLFSNITPIDFHLHTFKHLAESLKGYTQRVVISLADDYRKTHQRMQALQRQNIYCQKSQTIEPKKLETLLSEMVRIADDNGLQLSSCAGQRTWEHLGVKPGKCIDEKYIRQVFGIEVNPHRDHGQRTDCRCVASRDIGMYDSCLHGCVYCYANRDFALSRRNYRLHNPQGESLLPLERHPDHPEQKRPG